MTIEAKLDALTTAINNLAAAFADKQALAPKAPVVAAAPLATVAPSPLVAAPVAAPMPAFAMPGAASGTPAAVMVPFSDAKGLLNYVMEAYKSMGPTKGAGIQGVLTSLGVANINDVKAEQFAALYAGVEQLKAAP